MYNQGINGNWWPATTYDGSNAYRLTMISTAIDPRNYANKIFGFSLRLLSPPPAQPKPAGIRFRIYIPVAITLA